MLQKSGAAIFAAALAMDRLRPQVSTGSCTLNFLNHPFFRLGNNSPTAMTFGQVSSVYTGNAGSNFGRSVLLRAYLNW